MAGPDVFLTGATGYAGGAVLPELIRSGRNVTALVREPTQIEGAKTVVGELGVLEGLAEEIGGSAIVHLASSRRLERAHVLHDDIHGTGQLLDAWRSGPFVYSSTTTIHGFPRGILDEHTPVEIVDWYDAGKVVSEFQIRAAVEENEPGRGPGISLRPTLYFGPSRRKPVRQYLASYFYHAAAGHAFTFDSEEAMAQAGAAYVGLEDFGRAVVAALDSTPSAAYPIASGFVTWSDLVETINRVAGTSARSIVRPEGPQGPDEYRVGHSRTELDASAFTRATGWQPRQGLDELVDAFVRGEREAGRA